MKKVTSTILILLSFFFSCDFTSSNDKIKGCWVAEELTIYEQGETRKVKANENDNVYIGSASNPLVLIFNEYDEAVFTTFKNVYQPSIDRISKDPVKVFGYTMEGDTIHLEGAGSKNVKELNDTTLVLESEIKINYFNPDDQHGRGKWLVTTKFFRARLPN